MLIGTDAEVMDSSPEAEKAHADVQEAGGT